MYKIVGLWAILVISSSVSGCAFGDSPGAPPYRSINDISLPKTLQRAIPITSQDNTNAVVLYPDTASGKAAADNIVEAVRQVTGATLQMRPGKSADRDFNENVILVGNVFNNPGMQLLYARRFTPVDGICPGVGGYLLQTVHDPFGNGHGAIVVGASDDAGLQLAVGAFVKRIHAFGNIKYLSVPHLFEAKYSEELVKKYPWLTEKTNTDTISNGIKAAREIIKTGMHYSVAGKLGDTAFRYRLTGDSTYAKLFVALWDVYSKAVPISPHRGQSWGRDSDFTSYGVVSGWDNIEEDPALSDDDRLRVTKEMARWLREAVVIKAGIVPEGQVTHNHYTFPALGAFRAGLYFTQSYPDAVEGKEWLLRADTIFRNQAKYFKPQEDCNTYQWHPYRHVMQYSLARPDSTVFDNGNAAKIVDYGIATMNNLGYQVPYGDSGSWNVSFRESITMNMVLFATGNKTARWLINKKQELYKQLELNSYQNSPDNVPAPLPTGYDGVKAWPLEPAFVNKFQDPLKPSDDQLFDKISFRESIDPNTSYMLLDGINNLGSHGHRDGNSIEQLTQFSRIWLADNDYHSGAAKFHNTLLVLHNGQASPPPTYIALLGHGSDNNFGYSHTRMSRYSHADWDRYVIWLKNEQAFLVLDKVTALEDGEFQCRLMWHGVGGAKLDDSGLLLQQKGPSMRFQVGAGPDLQLADDSELGKNWRTYPYADPLIRSMSATSRVYLKKGEHYLFATAIHGKAEGIADAWKLNYLNGYNGVQVATGKQVLNVEVKDNNVLLQNVPGVTTFTESGNTHLSKSTFTAGAKIADAIVPPVKNVNTQYQAKAFREKWRINPRPQETLLTGAAKLSSDPVPVPNGNVLISSPNRLEDLLKDSPVMFPAGKTVKLTIDLHQPVPLSRVQWQQWWVKKSSKGTSYLLDRAIVEISDDNFAKDIRKIGELQDSPHPDGSIPAYEVDAKKEKARYVRMTFIPQTGSAIYLANIAVTGQSAAGDAPSPFQYTQIVTAQLQKGQPKVLLATTREGTLMAISPQGKILWSKIFPAPLNGVAAGDTDGDGIDEIGVARQDEKVTLMDETGHELWSVPLPFFLRNPTVNLIHLEDLDGDGKSEVVVGTDSSHFYAFDGEGKELWKFNIVNTAAASAIGDLDGDGKKEIVTGARYKYVDALNDKGKQLWRFVLKNPICYDIAIGHFDGDKTAGVILAASDGYIYYLDAKGTVKMKFNTGNEVKHVAAADMDGDGKDEILATSDNGYLYCFGADGKLRWLKQLESVTNALMTMRLEGRPVVVAGTEQGTVFAFDGEGKLARVSTMPAAIRQFRAVDENLIVACTDGSVSNIGE